MSTPDVLPRTRRMNLRNDAGIVIALVGIWVLLWGELSVANALSGTLVATALIVVFPIGHDVAAIRHHVRPLAAIGLIAYFLYDLLVSTAVSAIDTVRPRSRIRTGIVACPLRVDADGLVTLLANMIAVSPGTMPVEVAYNPHVIYVHALHAEDPEAIRRLVARLEVLAVRALGGPEAIAAVSRPAPWPPHTPEEPPDVDEAAS